MTVIEILTIVTLGLPLLVAILKLLKWKKAAEIVGQAVEIINDPTTKKLAEELSKVGGVSGEVHAVAKKAEKVVGGEL